jgi:hypothetical protein
MGYTKRMLDKELEARAFDSLIDAQYYEVQDQKYQEQQKLLHNNAMQNIEQQQEEEFINQLTKKQTNKCVESLPISEKNSQ